jgi:gliding motility-associated-like protein
MQLKKIFFLFLLFINIKCFAQLPQCNGIDSNKIFLISSGDVYRYDPTLAVSASNPSLFCNLGNATAGSLTISNNLNGGAASPTFYTVIGSNYQYWNGAALVNTTHTSGAVNPGGGIANIYSYLGGSNGIYKYNGSGNATFLTTIVGGGPYDLVTDVSDNFYFYDANITPGKIRKYDPLGVLFDSISVTSPIVASAGGGFAMTGSTVFASYSGGDIYTGSIIGTSVTLTLQGNVTYTIQDVAQCPGSVIAPSSLVADFNYSDTICAASCTTFTDVSIGKIASWEWTFNGATITGSTSKIPGPICYNNPGTYPVRLIVTDSLGQKDTVIKLITAITQPTAFITGDTSLCKGDTTILIANPIGATYLWSNGMTTSQNQIQPIVASTYSVVVSYGSCKDTATKNVTFLSNPIVTINPAVVYRCTPGDTILLNASGASSYSWNASASLGCSVCATAIVNPSVTTSYIVTGTDNFGCKAKDTVKVNIIPLQANIILAKDSFCLSAKLNATNASTGAGVQSLLWNLGDGTIINNLNSIIHQYASGNAYQLQLIIHDTLGCVDTAIKNIFVEDPGYINFTISDSVICSGNAIFVSDTFSKLPNSFSWDFDDNSTLINNIHNPMHVYDGNLINGIIHLQVKYRFCPTLDFFHSINVHNNPIVNIGPDTSICEELTKPIFLTDPNGNTNYLWNTGAITNNILVSTPGLYWVQANNFGCINSDSILIRPDCYLNIPNAFTPNADGLNNTFMPLNLMASGVTNFTMNIFNRWGENIFTTTNINSKGWDGKFGNVPQAMGVFVYHIDVIFKNGHHKTYTGNVTLIR